VNNNFISSLGLGVATLFSIYFSGEPVFLSVVIGILVSLHFLTLGEIRGNER